MPKDTTDIAQFGYWRLAAATPEIKVADPEFNSRQIIDSLKLAKSNKTSLVTYPELSTTGFTCGDLFHQEALLTSSNQALAAIAKATKGSNMIVVVGAPIKRGHQLFNCAVVIQNGSIRGVVPKTHLPNYREFYEKRWFTSGKEFKNTEIGINGEIVPFGTRFLFSWAENAIFGIELCEDLWHVIPPSSLQVLAGATICLNLSASDELVAKADYRRSLVSQQSARCMAAYLYTSAGVHESSTDLVFSGHAMIAENGEMLSENERFNRKNSLIYADIDCQRLVHARLCEGPFRDSTLSDDETFQAVHLSTPPVPRTLDRRYTPHPFVPSDPAKRTHRCQEIFNIQAAGFAKRLEHTRSEKAVIGISGGLDSTLALLVTVEAFKNLDKKNHDIIAITMPGFGTTGRTYQNAKSLCEALGVDLREISIKKACLQHFKDIGHDPDIHDVTYENVQARERTQILMNVANKHRGLVVGTGDLSEIALGWSTYNGDHMSMYAVNCGVPKTLIKYLIQWVADHSEETLKHILTDIIDTPISPELLPKGKDDQIEQKTEDVLGPYEIHDFFLYHTVKYGAPPEKLVLLAQNAFKGVYPLEKVKKCLKTFISRFFTHQFKRSCIPDGPKVGTICLSPRGDWRMPSDASNSAWQ